MIKEKLYEAMAADLLLLELEEGLGQEQATANEENADAVEGGRA